MMKERGEGGGRERERPWASRWPREQRKERKREKRRKKGMEGSKALRIDKRFEKRSGKIP